MSRPLPFFLPLVKVDASTGEFVASAALEVKDDGGEKFDYASSLPHFHALRKRSLAESGGKKEAPLRVMHQLIAGGNVERFHFDDGARAVAVHGKITDRDVLEKVLDGTLCGVSMGGRKKYLGFDADGSRRYTAIPNEISLVDLGAIPGTGVTMLNAAGPCEVTEADGTVRQLARAGATTNAVTITTDEGQTAVLANAVPAAESPAAAWARVHAQPDADRAEKRRIIADWQRALAAFPDDAERLAKGSGFYTVARLAELLESLDCLLTCHEEEEKREGDAAGLAIAARFDAAIHALGDVLVAMTAEEVAELHGNAAAGEPSGAPVAMTNAADAMRGLKGRVQRMHNMSVEMGAACAPLAACTKAIAGTPAEGEDGTMDEATLKKAVGDVLTAALGIGQDDGALHKAIGAAVTPVLEGLKKGVGEQFEKLEKATGERFTTLEKATGDKLDAIDARLKKVEDTPLPPKGATMALTKAADGVATAALELTALQELAKTDPVAAAKLIARQPGNAYHIDTQGVSPLHLG